MKLETLVRFHNDLVQFDSSKPVIVTLDKVNGLTYRQLGFIASFSYISNYYFPTKIRLGILTPPDLKEMIGTLEKLMQDNDLEEGKLSSTIDRMGFSFYRLLPSLIGPQKVYQINLISVENSFVSKLILRLSDLDTKNLYKIIKHENRECKSRK